MYDIGENLFADCPFWFGQASESGRLKVSAP